MVLDLQDAEGIIGKSVRSDADEDMGRIVDVIVTSDGDVKAVVIDFGGFLGVGSRKVAVDWHALKFKIGKPGWIATTLTRNQIRVSPEYKAGEPIVVLRAPRRSPVASSEAAPAAPPAGGGTSPPPRTTPAPGPSGTPAPPAGGAAPQTGAASPAGTGTAPASPAEDPKPAR